MAEFIKKNFIFLLPVPSDALTKLQRVQVKSVSLELIALAEQAQMTEPPMLGARCPIEWEQKIRDIACASFGNSQGNLELSRLKLIAGISIN